MKARDSIYNVGNDYPQWVFSSGITPTPGPKPEPGPGPEPGPEPTPTDPIESLTINETVNGDTMEIEPTGDTSTLDHYNVNVYNGEG